MEKKVLSEIALYSGKIKRPKGYEINRSKIKADILEAKLQNKSISDNPFDFRFFDYEARYSKELGYVIENTVEYARLNFQLNLEPVLTFANVLEHKEQSFSRLILSISNPTACKPKFLAISIKVPSDEPKSNKN